MTTQSVEVNSGGIKLKILGGYLFWRERNFLPLSMEGNQPLGEMYTERVKACSCLAHS
jgi:hypothetical protein